MMLAVVGRKDKKETRKPIMDAIRIGPYITIYIYIIPCCVAENEVGGLEH